MARKNTWQADFNQDDKKLILRWINENLSPWDRWGLPLIEIFAWKKNPTFTIPLAIKIDGTGLSLTCKDPKMAPARTRRLLRELGFPKDFIDSYTRAREVALGRRRIISEDEIFENMWLNLSHAGAGANLHKILTADKESARRWKAYLRAERKTWADVYLSNTAAAEIADHLLAGFEKDMGIMVRRGKGALRKRFQRYIKRYF